MLRQPARQSAAGEDDPGYDGDDQQRPSSREELRLSVMISRLLAAQARTWKKIRKTTASNSADIGHEGDGVGRPDEGCCQRCKKRKRCVSPGGGWPGPKRTCYNDFFNLSLGYLLCSSPPAFSSPPPATACLVRWKRHYMLSFLASGAPLCWVLGTKEIPMVLLW